MPPPAEMMRAVRSFQVGGKTGGGSSRRGRMNGLSYSTKESGKCAGYQKHLSQ